MSNAAERCRIRSEKKAAAEAAAAATGPFPPAQTPTRTPGGSADPTLGSTPNVGAFSPVVPAADPPGSVSVYDPDDPDQFQTPLKRGPMHIFIF